MASPALRLHDFTLSGHAHRARLFLALLKLPYKRVAVDLPAGAQKSKTFLAMNAFGQVPVLEDGTTAIADSNAILTYLALKYGDASWLPRDALGSARVQRWLSASAGPLAFATAAARACVVFKRPGDLAALRERAHALFAVMEVELSASPFLAAAHATIADIAMYSYTAHAPEGGVSLEPYPGIRAWLARIESLPGFVAMPDAASPAP